MHLLRLLVVSLLFVVASAPLAHSDEGERTYRKLALENGLRVVLASDATLNVSSASMAVGIGANADPEGVEGLAHFLEHMLFLATEKYPQLNGYGDFLQSRGGMSNAYTSQDHTNYHFQVNHDALSEVLDRFAQFFVSPTLDYKYAKREVAAVNSEHQKNTMDDTWRLMQLQRTLFPRRTTPPTAFSTGNAEDPGQREGRCPARLLHRLLPELEQHDLRRAQQAQPRRPRAARSVSAVQLESTASRCEAKDVDLLARPPGRGRQGLRILKRRPGQGHAPAPNQLRRPLTSTPHALTRRSGAWWA